MARRQAQSRSDQIYTNLSFIKPRVCLKTSNLEVWIASQRAGCVGRGSHKKELKHDEQAIDSFFHSRHY